MDTYNGTPRITDLHGNALACLTRMDAPNENWLQTMLANNPSLLPSDRVSPAYGKLICIGREIPVSIASGGTGKIDNLYVSPSGHLVIVETKLYRNPEAVREVVAQLLDYVTVGIPKWDYDFLNKQFAAKHDQTDLSDAMVKAGLIHPDARGRFIDAVNMHLANRDFLLMIVGDGIRQSVMKLIGRATSGYRVAVCDINLFKHSDQIMAIPHLSAYTEIVDVIKIENGNVVRGTPTTSANRKTDTKDILSMSEFIDMFCSANPDIMPEDLTNFINGILSMSNIGFGIKYTSGGLSITHNDMTLIKVTHTDIRLDARKLKTHAGMNDKVDWLIHALAPVTVTAKTTKSGTESFYILDKSIITNFLSKLLMLLSDFAQESKKPHTTKV